MYVVRWYRHTWSSWKNVKGPKMSRVLVRHRRLKILRTACVRMPKGPSSILSQRFSRAIYLEHCQCEYYLFKIFG